MTPRQLQNPQKSDDVRPFGCQHDLFAEEQVRELDLWMDEQLAALEDRFGHFVTQTSTKLALAR